MSPSSAWPLIATALIVAAILLAAFIVPSCEPARECARVYNSGGLDGAGHYPDTSPFCRD